MSNKNGSFCLTIVFQGVNKVEDHHYLYGKIGKTFLTNMEWQCFCSEKLRKHLGVYFLPLSYPKEF